MIQTPSDHGAVLPEIDPHRAFKLVSAKWQARRRYQGLKPGTEEHGAAQVEFFLGAHEALTLIGHPGLPTMLLYLLSVGRDCTELTKDGDDDTRL